MQLPIAFSRFRNDVSEERLSEAKKMKRAVEWKNDDDDEMGMRRRMKMVRRKKRMRMKKETRRMARNQQQPPQVSRSLSDRERESEKTERRQLRILFVLTFERKKKIINRENGRTKEIRAIFSLFLLLVLLLITINLRRPNQCT